MKRLIWMTLVLALAALPVLGAALESSSPPPAPTAPPKPTAAYKPGLAVYPTQVNLDCARDFQSLVAVVTHDDGVTVGATADAKITIDNPALAKVDGNMIRPLPGGDGDGKITVTVNGASKTLPLHVKNAAVDPPISFKLDVMPVFMAAGCNVGSCHGSARGKDGFRLSLFGFDPDGDYYRITREMSTRRINLADLRQSLLLLKATGKVAHTGGKRFEEDSAFYNTILRWLEAGAPKDGPDVAKVTGIELLPGDMLLEGEGSKQQLTVLAHYSDGTDRDVTSEAVFITNNDNSAAVTPAGLVTAGKRGEAFVTVRFNTYTVGSAVIVIPRGERTDGPRLVENNYIDTLVSQKLRKLRITPAGLCSDEVFVRRAYLDIVGLLPTPAERQKFIADTNPRKREKLVDELIARPEFTDLWVMKWAELLEIRSTNDFSYKSALVYYQWLADKMAAGVPIDQIVRELVTATGTTFKNPAANYYEVNTDTLKLAENTAQVFLGVRTQCSQCHNHPFDRWTLDDYYGFAAFFAQVGRKNGEDPREKVVFNGGGGDVRHPVTNQVAAPKFLGGAVADLKGRDRREVLADWLTAPENPWFARNIANIVWANYMGKGIIDPVDDVRISNPASNPELLDALAQALKGYKFDIKKLVRDICLSRAYQLATQTNATNEMDSRNFSHAAIRRVRAEVLLDCINEVTETKEKFKGLPIGGRAVQIADGNVTNYFLTTFGRATRESVCSCEVSMQPSLSQALTLLNGVNPNNKLQGGGVIVRMINAKRTDEDIIEELYLRCFSRMPTKPEMAAPLKTFPDNLPPADRQKALEDIFWALLNSREFLFNH